MEDLIHFYYHPWTRGGVVHWMLEEIGQPYKVTLLDYNKNEHKKPEYLKINPMGKIPAIIHRGVTITEVAAQHLILNKNKITGIAVLKCVDDKYKEIESCPLVEYCEAGFFEIYTKKENRFELLVKTQKICQNPTIQSKNGIIFLKSEINFGSSAKITDKYRFEDGKFKLIDIDYSVRHNGLDLRYNRDPAETIFKVNTLTGQIVQTDYFSKHNKKIKKCKMNDNLKNLTIADVPDSGYGNLQCP